jgi:hypothetical protein
MQLLTFVPAVIDPSGVLSGPDGLLGQQVANPAGLFVIAVIVLLILVSSLPSILGFGSNRC